MKITLYIQIVLLGLATAFSTALAQPPQSPDLLLPEHNAQDVTPTNIHLQWASVPDAFYYHIQIARNPNFTGLLDVDQNNISGTEYTFTLNVVNNVPEAQTVYYWRVTAGNNYGESAWSQVRTYKTGFPDGQAIVVRLFGTDTLVGMIALNSRDAWNTQYLYSKVKNLRRDTTALYRQEDFPYLYIEPFTVRRIDFMNVSGTQLRGHIQFDYRFSDVPPFGERTDLLVYFHPKRVIPKSRYPKWTYYANGEMPVTAFVPPGGLLKNIDTAKIPILLIHGAGYTTWGQTPAELTVAGYDVWQWIYPAEAPVDSSAALLGEAMKRLAAIYGEKKIGIAAHGTGGLVARAYLQSPLNIGNVGKLLMLGTPNHGSYFAYKLAYTEEFTSTAGEYVRRLDRNAPLWPDVSPGSDFLSGVNATIPVLLSGVGASSSYLAVAGTSDIPLGWAHNEIAGFDDGLSAVSSVSLLDKNLPFATVAMAHIPTEGYSGKNLLQNTGTIISGFMSAVYSPYALPQDMALAVESFIVQPGYVIKPDNRMFEAPGIETWEIPKLYSPRLSVVRDKTASTLTMFPESDVLETESRYGMLRNPSSGRYFSVNRAGDGGIGWEFIGQNHALRFADYIRYPIDPQGTSRRRRAIPVSAEPLTLRINPLLTAERTVKVKQPIVNAWMTGVDRRHEMYVFPEKPERTAVRDTIGFRIDPYMDTMLVIATPLDNTAPLAPAVSAGFTLLAPNGMSFDAARGNDSTIPQYTAGGAERFAADGVAYYFMSRPMPGNWSIVCNTAAQPLRFVVSFLSDVSLRIETADSVFSTGDSVYFTVVLPNYFFNDIQVRALLYYDTNPDSSLLGVPLDLTRDVSNPALYHGVFKALANGMYYIRADFSAQFPESRISRTAFRAIEVADALPELPQLLFPPRLAADVPRNTYLAWKHDVRARSYRIQVARDFWFDTLLVDRNDLPDTLMTLPGLAESTTYYWRVSAKNARGITEWSDVFWFKTGGKALGITPLTSPKNGTIAVRRDTVFTWEKVTGAPLYQIQITKDSLFYAYSIDTLIFGTSCKFSLENSARYFWHVRALTGTGEFGPWSDVWRIRRLVPSPELSLPEHKAEGLPVDVKFVWLAPIAGLKYRLQVSYRPDFQPTLLDIQDISDTTYTISLPKSGTIYFWRVQWVSPDASSDWSPLRSFATIVASPKLDSPGDGVTGVNVNPTLTWNSVPDYIYYHLQLSKEPDFVTPIFNDSTLGVISKSMKSLDPLTRYFWRVRTIATAGSSPWSDIWEFVTGENPNGVSEAIPDKSAITIAPNPASDECYVEITLPTEATAYIEISDALGVVVWKRRTEIISGATIISVSVADMPPGIYRLRITASGFAASSALVIAR